MGSGINKYWKQLDEFGRCVIDDYHFTILDRTWYNNGLSYVGEFFLRPNVKDLNLWI